MKKGQLTTFIIVGLIVVLGMALLTTVIYQVLVFTGIMASPIATSELKSYMQDCFDKSLKCSLYKEGLDFSFQPLLSYPAIMGKEINGIFSQCMGDKSKRFRGREIMLFAGNETSEAYSPKISLAKDETILSIEDFATIRVGKGATDIGAVTVRTPIAFSDAYSQAIIVNQGDHKLLPTDKIIRPLPSRYKVKVFAMGDKDGYIYTDVNSSIDRKPYSLVFTR